MEKSLNQALQTKEAKVSRLGYTYQFIRSFIHIYWVVKVGLTLNDVNNILPVVQRDRDGQTDDHNQEGKSANHV